MLITILVIFVFQAYWLKDNYDREKRTMQIKTNVSFQETVRQMQTARLKFPDPFINDSGDKGKKRIFVDEDINETWTAMSAQPRREIVTMINAMRNKITGTLRSDSNINSTVFIRLAHGKDSLHLNIRNGGDSIDHIYRTLYSVDSLQDSIRLPELISSYATTLKKENLDVPFSITLLNGAIPDEQQDLSEVTVGFAHPVTYHLALRNTAPYLLKKLLLPILFSLFLVGVTIFSFLLLYRNLVRQQRLAKIKNEFISNMTHELKTPIATVGVAIEALKNFNAIDNPEKTKEYLDISQNELQRLSLLVDNVLQLSMFEKKQIELNKEHVDLKELTREVLDSMRLQFEKNNAVINFRSEGNSFPVSADKLHITSVIYNLLDNALKYSKEALVIDVQLFAQQNNINLKVSDNGIGIAPEYRTKIFDKFFRVPTGNEHTVKGYGLGLSYVSEIIKSHNGFINLESELGKGSTFTVRLLIEEA